jgi:hypothetical protein
MRLEDELCWGISRSIDEQPCPARDGTRLAFYITSLTKPNTSRDAAAQLMMALPLNLFLALHARAWTTFYVRRPEFTPQLAAESPAAKIKLNIHFSLAGSRGSSLFQVSLSFCWQQSSSTSRTHITLVHKVRFLVVRTKIHWHSSD